MTDFTNISALRIPDEATTEFTFYGIAGEPSLTCRPATQENKPFFNRVLMANKKAIRQAKGRTQSPSVKSLEDSRANDIEMFVEFIVTGWSNVVDAKGKAVKFTAEVCKQFLEAIPTDMFDELRLFCLDINNFREMMDEEELEELAGN